MVDYKFIQEHIEDFQIGNIKVSAVSEYGIAIELFVPAPIDLLDFVEEIGIYFYKLDDPKFGQKFINEETKNFVYDWLVQLLNTGNYEDVEDGLYALIELYMDFELLHTFKYVLRKYKLKYESDKKNDYDMSKLFAEGTAINILEIIEKVKSTQIEENI